MQTDNNLGLRSFPTREHAVGAGVREPPRPYPLMPAGALELDPLESQYLEMAAEPARTVN